MSEHFQPPARGWLGKFGDAFQGIYAGMYRQGSFYIHLPVAVVVTVLAIVIRVTWIEGCLLGLCITVVLGAEMMNSALERLAKAISSDFHDDIRVGLNIASGAVLVVSLGAAIIGVLIFAPRLLALLATN